MYEENTNSEVYINILEDNLLPFTVQFYNNPGDWLLTHDGARYHGSTEVRQFMIRKGIEAIIWPLYSPDLNPVENLWASLKLMIAEKTPASFEELEKAIYEAWTELPSDFIPSPIDSMPNRIEDLILADGYYIEY